jgi:Phage integrase, N-terminal SAM-like domain
MTATTPSTALVTIQPEFTESERLALAGFLAGYRGLAREAYTLDLRQFTAWCHARALPLFSVRRADIETFARKLEARGRVHATVTRRLCTIAGFYRYAVEEELLEHSPPRTSAARGWIMSRTPPRWTATSSAQSWSPPGLARLPSTLSSRCSRSTGYGYRRRPARTSSTWAWNAGTAPW